MASYPQGPRHPSLPSRRVPANQAGQGKRGTGARGVSANEVEAFLHDGRVLPVSSSNWEACQYIAEEKLLIVKYKDSPDQFGYEGVTEQEALSLANASSMGAWGWSVLRVRGSKTAHKKSFRKMAGFRASQAQ